MFKFFEWLGGTRTETGSSSEPYIATESQSDEDDVEIVAVIRSTSPPSATPQSFMHSVLNSSPVKQKTIVSPNTTTVAQDDVEIVAVIRSTSPPSATPQSFMHSVLNSSPVKQTTIVSPNTTTVAPQETPVLKERNRIAVKNRFVTPKSVDHWSRKKVGSISKKSLTIRKANTDANYSPINLSERDKYMRMLKSAESPFIPSPIRNRNACVASASKNVLDYKKLERVKKMLREKGTSGSSSPSQIHAPVIPSVVNVMPEVLVEATPRRSTSESSESRNSSCRDKLDDIMCLFDKQMVVTGSRHYLDDFAVKAQSAHSFGNTYSVTRDICSKSRLDQKSIAEEQTRKYLALRGIIAPKPKPAEKDEFPKLSDDALSTVACAWDHGRMDEVFADAFDIQIARKDLKTLRAPNWLNDEVINFYLQLICQRSKDVEELPKVYAFNTFFYPNITTKGYASVKRWTRKVDIFAFDIILVPVHMHNNHWCMAIIDISNKRIDYFDSLHGKNQKCLDALRDYLISEHTDKKKSSLNMAGWIYQMRPDCPAQMNGSDCGMFSVKFAEFASRRKEVSFTQEHMPYYRQRAVYEIITKKLL